MKNFLSLFLVLLSTFLFSCEKEDVNSASQSNMNIYGTTIPIKSGVLLESNKNTILERIEFEWQDKYTDKGGVSREDNVVGFFRTENRIETGNFMLSLHGDGLTFLPDLVATKGEGAIVSLHLASPDLKQVVPGKYTFSDSKLPNTFIGYLSTSYNMSGTATAIASITGGEVTVVDEGNDNYSVDVNVKLSSGVTVICNYKGALVKGVVNQPKMAKLSNIALNGLLPMTKEGLWFSSIMTGGPQQPTSYSDILDTSDKSFLSIASGAPQSANQNKAVVEIALALDRPAKEFTFLSPIKARSILGHLEKHNFPCHTIYMSAPSSFTDSDYANLEKTGITFEIKEEVVKFSLENFKPGYVFFDAGSGTRGVINVKSVLPAFETYTEEMNGWIRIYKVMSEQLLCDIKATTNFGNPKLR